MIGANGAGKSTLLKTVAGLVPLTPGASTSATNASTRCRHTGG